MKRLNSMWQNSLFCFIWFFVFMLFMAGCASDTAAVAPGTERPLGAPLADKTYVDNKVRDVTGSIYEALYGKPVSLSQSQINKNIGFDGSGNDENNPIQIGKYAVSAMDQETVSGVTADNAKIRNVGIAIGAHAETIGVNSTKNQNIAIGFMAKSKGSSMIAIGPGAKDSDEDDWTGNSTYAEGSATTAIGYSAKAKGNYALAIGSGASGTGQMDTLASNNYAVAVGPSAQALAEKAVGIGTEARSTAKGAVQIGTGVNNEANTLKFQDTTIVRDGQVVGGFDPQELDPKTIVPDSSDEAVAQSHTINTIECTTMSTYPEIGLTPTTTRNYEVYVDNNLTNRSNLPLCMEFEGPTLIGKKPEPLRKLPALIKLREPVKGKVLVEAQHIDDGYEWHSDITNDNINVAYDEGKLRFLDAVMLGTELQLLTSWQLILSYVTPVSGVVTCKLSHVNALYNKVTLYGSGSAPLFETNAIPHEWHLEGSGDKEVVNISLPIPIPTGTVPESF